MSLHWNTFHYTASALELLMPSVCLNRVIGISLELIQPKLLLNASFCFKCLSASRLISPWNVIKFFNHSIKCTQFDNYNPRFVLTNAVIQLSFFLIMKMMIKYLILKALNGNIVYTFTNVLHIPIRRSWYIFITMYWVVFF